NAFSTSPEAGTLVIFVNIPDTLLPYVLTGWPSVGVIHLADDERLLHLLNRFGDLDVARAGVGAVEHRPAAPDAGWLVEDVETLGGALVPAVDDEAMRVHDRRRADIFTVDPCDRAGGGAGRAEDALGRVV